jgi:hypothetical protein
MYTKVAESLKHSFTKNVLALETLPIAKYMDKIEEFNAFLITNPEDIQKGTLNVVTPRVQKLLQYNVIKSVLTESGIYVLSAEDGGDTSDTALVGWSGGHFTFPEVQKALQGTAVKAYKKKPNDTIFESCISHGGYTLVQNESGSNPFVSDSFYKVKDKNGNIRMIMRVPFFDRTFKNQKKAMAELQTHVQRDFLDSTGKMQVLTELKLIPHVHDYFVCFSDRWDTNKADTYIVQDFVENAIGLDEYVKKNKERLNNEAILNIKKRMSEIIHTIYSKTEYRYKYNRVKYGDFMCALDAKQVITHMYLKRLDSSMLIHKDEEQEQLNTRNKERVEREERLLMEMNLLFSKTMRDTERMQMNVAIMMMVNSNALGSARTSATDVVLTRTVGLKTTHKASRGASSNTKRRRKTRV